jgi:hypothetical protein
MASRAATIGETVTPVSGRVKWLTLGSACGVRRGVANIRGTASTAVYDHRSRLPRLPFSLTRGYRILQSRVCQDRTWSVPSLPVTHRLTTDQSDQQAVFATAQVPAFCSCALGAAFSQDRGRLAASRSAARAKERNYFSSQSPWHFISL